MEFTNILSESEFSDSDLSLLSWLQVIIVHDVIFILKPSLNNWNYSVIIAGHILLSLWAAKSQRGCWKDTETCSR